MGNTMQWDPSCSPRQGAYVEGKTESRKRIECVVRVLRLRYGHTESPACPGARSGAESKQQFRAIKISNQSVVFALKLKGGQSFDDPHACLAVRTRMAGR